jgi:hypothetical protein
MVRVAKRSTIIKKLDAIFSLYIRNYYADSNGQVECITCQRFYPVAKIQNGHFISRKNYATRWSEDNVAPQCYGCNVMQQGQQFLFSKWIDEKYGEGYSQTILERSRTTVKFSNPELLDMIDLYTQKLKDLL